MPPITDELESDDEFRETVLELNTSSPPILVDFRPKGSPKSDTGREKQKRLSQEAYYKSNEGSDSIINNVSFVQTSLIES